MIPIKDNIPTDRFPVVTFAVIVADVVLYIVLGHHASRYGVTPGAVKWWTLLSAMFVHSSIVALAGNMWFLWLFGNNVEDSMGPVRFLAFYLLGGIVAAAVLIAVNASGTAVGAAGAVSAVVAGYLVLYPRGRILGVVIIPLLFTVIEVPAMVMAGLWLVMQMAFAATGLTVLLAPIAGFAVGLAAIRPLATRRKPTPPTAAAFPWTPPDRGTH